MTHKLTLENPPEGYEAVAEYRHVSTGEVFISESGPRVAVSQYDQGGLWIVLTPKKKKFWRLDPVATFEEATPFPKSLRGTYLSVDEDGRIYYRLCDEAYRDGITWLKATQHEE